MPIKDYIIETLNVSEDNVEPISVIRQGDTFLTTLKLVDKHPLCPKCGENAPV